MFGRKPDRFPLLDIKTPNGGRIVIGPCAVRLIVRILATIVVAVTLLLFGPDLGKELAVLLQAVGL